MPKEPDHNFASYRSEDRLIDMELSTNYEFTKLKQPNKERDSHNNSADVSPMMQQNNKTHSRRKDEIESFTIKRSNTVQVSEEYQLEESLDSDLFSTLNKADPVILKRMETSIKIR